MAPEREQEKKSTVKESDNIPSRVAFDYATRPGNSGSMEDADGFASITGPCGDTMAIWLKVDDGIISDASFTTDGCTTTIASGSMITEMAKGKTVGQAQEIGQRDVLDALQNLPEDSQHCALLAANTLKEAIKDYLASATPS